MFTSASLEAASMYHSHLTHAGEVRTVKRKNTEDTKDGSRGNVQKASKTFYRQSWGDASTTGKLLYKHICIFLSATFQ